MHAEPRVSTPGGERCEEVWGIKGEGGTRFDLTPAASSGLLLPLLPFRFPLPFRLPLPLLIPSTSDSSSRCSSPCSTSYPSFALLLLLLPLRLLVPLFTPVLLPLKLPLLILILIPLHIAIPLCFTPPTLGRSGEDDVASRAVVRLMAQALGVQTETPLSLPLITQPSGGCHV